MGETNIDTVKEVKDFGIRGTEGEGKECLEIHIKTNTRRGRDIIGARNGRTKEEGK